MNRSIPLVEDLVSKKIYSIASKRSVFEAAEEMARNKVGSLLVTHEERYVGIITEFDITRKVVANGINPFTIAVGEVMSFPLITIEGDWLVLDAIDLMEEKQIRHLAVSRNHQIIGVVSVRDFLRPLHMEQEACGF